MIQRFAVLQSNFLDTSGACISWIIAWSILHFFVTHINVLSSYFLWNNLFLWELLVNNCIDLMHNSLTNIFLFFCFQADNPMAFKYNKRRWLQRFAILCKSFLTLEFLFLILVRIYKNILYLVLSWYYVRVF